MKSASFQQKLILLLIIIAGTLIRYDFARPFNFIIDSDEAIVGLMAKHISEGAEIPTFYYGQHYMGSLEALLAALSFKVFGISNIALKIVPFLFSIALIPLIYLMTKRCASINTALLAALFIAVPPTPLVVWSSKARGGFIEVIFIGALALLTTLIWLQSNRPRLGLTALTGLLLGLGWWVNNQVIYFMVPIGLVFLEHLLYFPERNKIANLFIHGAVGIAAFLFGGLPFWIYNLNNDFVTFAMFAGAGSKDLGEHVSGLFSTALPIILGGMRFWQEEEYFPGGSQIALFIYGLIFVAAVCFCSRRLFRFVTLRGISREAPVEIFVVFVLATLTIFTLSSFGYLVQAPRYLLPVYVGLMPLCAYAISQVGKVIGTTMILIVLAINLGSSYWHEKAVPGEPYVYNGERASTNHHDLIQWLEANNYTFVRTNYWIGYRLAFESQEKIKFIMLQEPFQVRIPAYEDQGHALTVRQIPMVLVPTQAKIVRHALRAQGMTYKQLMLSGYVVIYDQDSAHLEESLKPVDPALEVISSNPHNENAKSAVDGDVHTRWASAEHQHPGMFFRIDLKRPVAIRALKLELGEWAHDYPRSLEIVLYMPNGTSKLLVGKQDYQAIRYLQFNEAVELFTPATEVTAVELRQVGSHPIFDWSIAEIELLE